MSYSSPLREIQGKPRTWLVTGVAGFIGSHLLEELLRLNQKVVGLDNFATGKQENLKDVRKTVGEKLWDNFQFMEGDITSQETCHEACRGVELVLHQAALGSVPRSIHDPARSNLVNVQGTLHMMLAARDAKVSRFVYASSSSIYGDNPILPRVEDEVGTPLSPYAVTKRVVELYAQMFTTLYGISTVGLRYFNVFGPRQDPNGAYAAVIPRWIGSLLSGAPCVLHGDGTTSRDFCYVKNVVQANLGAALAEDEKVKGTLINIACGSETTLTELYELICTYLRESDPSRKIPELETTPFRQGDVKHSRADISLAKKLLGYEASHDVRDGLRETVGWYCARG